MDDLIVGALVTRLDLSEGRKKKVENGEEIIDDLMTWTLYLLLLKARTSSTLLLPKNREVNVRCSVISTCM
jgi:hypothetical protein